MEFKEPNHSLLARYLAGECTREERAMVEQWVEAHPENKQKLKEFKRIWALTGGEKVNRQGAAPENEWNHLKEQLAQEESPPSAVINDMSSSRRPKSIHSTFQQVIRVAAIFLVTGLFGILSYTYWSAPESDTQLPEPILREVSTSIAQRANLTLGDGTKVILNADTKMEFPTKFASDIREVYLEGEAYFNVVSNPEKPFVIYTGETTTRVLGTSFVVRSYPEDQQVQVVVEEGRVSFGATARQDSFSSTLTRNELGQYSQNTHRIRTRNIEDLELYLGWRKGALKFKEAPMEKVAEEIERRYGVEITFRDASITEMNFTAFLKSRSIRKVLDVIATSLNINYRLEENNVTFYQG